MCEGECVRMHEGDEGECVRMHKREKGVEAEIFFPPTRVGTHPEFYWNEFCLRMLWAPIKQKILRIQALAQAIHSDLDTRLT